MKFSHTVNVTGITKKTRLPGSEDEGKPLGIFFEAQRHSR